MDYNSQQPYTRPFAYTRDSPTRSYQEENIVAKRFSPSKGDANDSFSNPPRNANNSVISKADEALQRSLKFTGNSINDTYAQKKTYTFASPTNTSSQSFSSKTNEVLDRANEILKRSVGYANQPYQAEKTYTSKAYEVPSRPESYSKDLITTQTGSYGNRDPSSLYTAEKSNNPRQIISRVDEALQNSSNITSSIDVYASNSRGFNSKTTMRAETRAPQEIYKSPPSKDYQETVKRNPYGTPQRISSEYGSGTKYLRSGDLDVRNQNLNEVYGEALRRSQELATRNEEVLQRSINRASVSGNKRESNLRSSNVIERQTNAGISSPYAEDQDDGRLGLQELAAPGIYLPSQGIKPKFAEEYYEDGTIYKGEKIRDAKHGRGEYLYANGVRYEGEWENDRRNGYGVLTFPNGNINYDGEWKDDVFHGNGILVNGDAEEEISFDYRDFDTLENHWRKYEGEFLGGKMHGLGTLTLFNNERYVGKFKYDKVHGAGVFHKRNGETISGEWENNKFARAL